MKFIKWGLISVAILALLVSAGTFVYINVIEGDPPEKLTFGDTVDRQEQVTTSSIARLQHRAVGDRLAPLVEAGLVATCSIIDLTLFVPPSRGRFVC